MLGVYISFAWLSSPSHSGGRANRCSIGLHSQRGVDNQPYGQHALSHCRRHFSGTSTLSFRGLGLALRVPSDPTGLGLPTVNSFSLAAETSNSNQSPIFAIVIYALLFGGMYFIFLRPRNRRMKEARALAANLAVGDEVVLNSGIYGFVSDIDGDVLWLDIADGHQQERIEIRVTRGAVARKVTPTGDDASKQ